ncbi:MAG: HAMP domain-containing histidine kinase, partial [Thermoproteota archaeon]|nr:HAMP domain-containing histidine kinase [Thermoproteota archaeon]
SYSNLLSSNKRGKVKESVRWVTHIEDNKEQVNLINIFLNLGIEIRHANNLPPMSFALSDKQFQGTIEKMEHGKMFKNILYSTEPLYIKHFQSIFEEIWRNGIDARHRISQIEMGIASETTRVIENSIQTKELIRNLIDNAKEEIMIVIPSLNAVKMQKDIGIIDLLKQKGQENLRIRILSPLGNTTNEILLLSHHNKDKNQSLENIIVRQIVKQQNIKSILLMVDNKYLLSVELKDDLKKVFEDAIGLATYSTSKPTILSYTSIFETLWTQTEMYEILRIANEKLQIHDKMQQEFINNAAHELRTPSQAILGYAELALIDYDIKDKDKNIRYLEAISRNAERLTRLAEKILSVARIESNTLKIDKEFFDLGELISNIIEEFDLRLKKLKHKEIEFVFEKKTIATKQKDNPISLSSSSRSTSIQSSFLVKADREKIEQVIVNLLDNAIKFSKEKVSVRILKDKSQVIVEVKDCGPGIDREILPNIFSKFVSKSDVGTGLGLFISKSIIKTHGGQIWAQNNYDKGATFSFSLPLD